MCAGKETSSILRPINLLLSYLNLMRVTSVTIVILSIGHKYFDIGNGAEIATIMAKVQESDTAGLEDFNKNGLNAKLFYAVSRAPGSYSVYVGLTDPRAPGERECAIQPFYLSSRGLIPADKITITQQRPFAWLRHFRIETDGTTTLKTSPWQDEVFKRELAEFSNKQSKLLCERKSLCGTIDAHYALLLSRTPTVKLLSSKEEAALKPKDIFKECDECPEMVVVPSGGLPVPHQFAVGRYAVTFEEWDACVADMACEQRSDAGWGRGRRPAINVSWHDAKSYVAWLTNKTGKPYRLLTEKEHEYAARAGTETPFWWGSTISSSQANYDGGFVFGEGAKGQFRARTMPVDSFNPNPWGLYQVHGNVSEWTEDCYKSYAPTAQTNSDCRSRVIRGGSWWDIPISLRSGSRDRLADSSDNKTGFRVARTIGNVAPLKGNGGRCRRLRGPGLLAEVRGRRADLLPGAAGQVSKRARLTIAGGEARPIFGKKGVYYRAFAGPFSSADQATQVCDNLKAAGGPQCIIQRN